jgi:hypothetical protein
VPRVARTLSTVIAVPLAVIAVRLAVIAVRLAVITVRLAVIAGRLAVIAGSGAAVAGRPAVVAGSPPVPPLRRGNGTLSPADLPFPVSAAVQYFAAGEPGFARPPR